MKPKIEHLYIHVPFCDGKCLYCGFYSELYTHESAASYLSALENELRLSNTLFDIRPSTIYFGGGTPAILETDQLAGLLEIVWNHIPLSDVREWSIEATPGTLSIERAVLLQKKKINRISIGVQSFNNTVLKSIGRRHTADAVGKTMDVARVGGINNIGLDLIACLPGVDETTWESDIHKAISLKPRHISVYALSVEKNSLLGKLPAGKCPPLPDDNQLVTALDIADEFLREANYVRYETSNYSLKGSECLHNLSCWRGEDYLGLGPVAASRVGLKRWTNTPDLKSYSGAVNNGAPAPCDEETLTPLTDVTERLMFSFRLTEGVDLEKFRKVADAPIEQWEATLCRLSNEGLTEKRDLRWFLTKQGRHYADHVARELV
jgi:oxygen-independent coproporphyrinogen-3 oxidase